MSGAPHLNLRERGVRYTVSMARRTQPLWKEYLGSLAVAYGFAGVFVFFAPVPWPQRLISAALSGFVFGTMFFVIGALTSKIKSRVFAIQVLIRSLLICGTLVAGMIIVIPASIATFAGGYPWSAKNWAVFKTVATPEQFATWIAIGFGLSVLINGSYSISKKLGPNVFVNWLTGKYYSPKEEERIFMFLDLKNSTTLAEKLGSMRFMKLCQEFFRDLNFPVTDTKGEVSHYIGDEAVLTWKPKRGLDKANCIRAFFLMQEEIQARNDFYLQEFGFLPEFKAGVHIGPVVGAEVGEVKSEIVFLGDVLNTAARITGLCAEVNCDLLISGDLLKRLTLPEGLKAQSLGMRLLKGKEQEVEIVAVRHQSQPQAVLEEMHIERAASLTAKATSGTSENG